MPIKIRKLTRNNVWVDKEAIISKEAFGDDYEMYVSYCDSRRIVERKGKYYECIILPIPKTLWDNLDELIINPKYERARNIQQLLGENIPFLNANLCSFDDANTVCGWYDFNYICTPEYYPNPILGL